MAIYKRNDIYWYDFRVAKVRHRGSTGEVNKRKAEAFHDDLKARKKREAKGLEVTITTKHTIHKTIDEYIEHCKRAMRSSTNKYKIITFQGGKKRKPGTKTIKEIVPEAPLQTINKDHLKKIRAYGHERGLKTSSANRLCNEFQAFAAWATEEDYFAADPIQHIKGLPVEDAKPKLISDDQFTELLNNVPMWLREIVWVDWLIGVRLSNVVGLRYDQIHWEEEGNEYIEFAPSEMKKGKNTRIDLEDLPELVNWFKIRRLAHPEDTYVWMSPSYKDGFGHFSLSYVGRRFSRTAKELGLDVTFHSIRHTFATRWAESGMDLHSLSKLLAHKDMNSTKRYVHVEDVNLQRIAKKKVARIRKVPVLSVVNSGSK